MSSFGDEPSQSEHRLGVVSTGSVNNMNNVSINGSINNFSINNNNENGYVIAHNTNPTRTATPQGSAQRIEATPATNGELVVESPEYMNNTHSLEETIGKNVRFDSLVRVFQYPRDESEEEYEMEDQSEEGSIDLIESGQDEDDENAGLIRKTVPNEDRLPYRYIKKGYPKAYHIPSLLAKSKLLTYSMHYRIFTILVCVVDIIMMAVEFGVNKGMVSFKVNMWGGVSAQTLLTLGAKYTPWIIYENQWWRLVTPIFLHAGIFHLLINLLAQGYVCGYLERNIGSLRVAFVYLVSGVCGNLMSAAFLPNQIEAGASGAIYGVGSYLLADLVAHWRIMVSPVRYLLIFLIGTTISFFLGIFPGIDNFAHFGGGLAGFFASMAVLPPRDGPKKRNSIMCSRRGDEALLSRMIGVPLLVLYLVFLVCLLYVTEFREAASTCKWCEYLNCWPVFKQCKAQQS
eukprot:TRINITY_DN772_c0_g1_i1.p1 TRINITY_DN772_c0_g1~~TRINITY_DN772_c0_g1_i1.p1  ORF type:complete len:458 (+),score=82.78 TRINITY_DN772_c0_g1_i1:240-1613(+)